MKPILYPPEERDFTSNGLGVLSDAISCVVTWSGNGVFDLTMEYPMDGIHFDEIADKCIIYAIRDPYSGPQPFDINDIVKTMDGTVTIYAQHVAYRLAGYPLNPFTASNAAAAMAGLSSNAETDTGFTFWTNKATTANFSVLLPTNIWAVLGGSEGSVLDVYGGQYEFDHWAVKLHDQLGQDNGVTIRYGKNLIDLEQERNLSKMYTGVYPFWADTEGNIVVCDPKIIPIEGNFAYTNVLTLDLSSEWQEAPTPEQLKTRTERYIKDNGLGNPTVSITLTHEMLEQTDEYSNLSLQERCSVFDTVTVQFEKLGIDAKATIAEAQTDVLNEKYLSLKVGSVRANIADTINNQQTEIQNRPTTGRVEQLASIMAATVIGAKGGAVRMIDTNGDKWPDEFYIADNPDPAKAKKVWRFNYEGWVGSKNGYNGPFNIIGTLDGIYADAIIAGTLDASLIKVINLIADHVQSKSGNYMMELWAAVLTLFDGENMRTRIYTTGTENSIGNVQVFSGNVKNGEMQTGSRVSQFQPSLIECGSDGKGDYDGIVKTGEVQTKTLNVPANGTITVGDGSYSGWELKAVTTNDGKPAMIMCHPY